ncbi:hypothetical protein BGZ96_002221 [Linnemannia gamsii]|uniref:F-box domain-containing protein n=1 Tax=Linnemannia gamsii TaxID=64522 RepID=A0ABQ7K8A9_9FUNG|nr:hypothetical protein BGZ96_002221 [Linnemannia gamsii]
MDIPEVAEHIFSYLDDFTINNNIILVCRKWLVAGLYRINREATWDTNDFQDEEKEEKHVLSRFQDVSRINCYLRDGIQLTDKWEALCEALGKRHRMYLARLQRWQHGYLVHREERNNDNDDGDDTGRATQRRGPLMLPLREVRIHGFVDLSISRLFPYFPSITRLQIHFSCDGAIEMRLLLNNCPRLESLSLRSIGTLKLSGPWILNEHNAKKRYPLAFRRLDFRRVQLPQASLETLLTVSPYVQQITVYQARHKAAGPYAVNEVKLAEHAKKFCRHLQSFHFSNRENGSNSVVIQLSGVDNTSSPYLTGVGHLYSGYEFVPSLVRNLQLQATSLTRLEILANCPELHSCLCDLPTLMHLRAPGTFLSLDDIDIHLRQSYGRLSPRLFPRLWACRDLQTLHIGCRAHGSDGRLERHVFGYISVLCPKLRDLEISGAQDWMWLNPTYRPRALTMTLEGGFCLLGRLKLLERLRVGSADINVKLPSWHWDWMVVSPDSRTEVTKQQKRLKVIKSWRAKMEEEAFRNKLRLQGLCLLEGVQDPTAHLGNDEQLKAQLEHLGLLKDVAFYLEGIPMEENSDEGDVGGRLKRWPRLQRVSIYRTATFGYTLEKEVERLIMVGKVEMSIVMMSTLKRHRHFLGTFVFIAVLVSALGLPKWPLWTVVVFLYLIAQDEKKTALTAQ